MFLEALLLAKYGKLNEALKENPTWSEILKMPMDEQESWNAAIDAELSILKKNATYEEISPDTLDFMPTMKPKFVFKIKRDHQGRIIKYKARLVACR